MLVVQNDFGQVVARLTVAADAETVTWNGQDELGRTLPHGRYGFSLESYVGETPARQPARPGLRHGDEVRLVDGAPVLVVEGGAQVPLDEVGAVR